MEVNEALKEELAAKQSKKGQRQAEKESSKGFWVELLSVELVNHKQAKNVYMKTFQEEAKSGETRLDKAFFDELDSPELSTEIKVCCNLPQICDLCHFSPLAGESIIPFEPGQSA